jgi:hypothetical protein
MQLLSFHQAIGILECIYNFHQGGELLQPDQFLINLDFVSRMSKSVMMPTPSLLQATPMIPRMLATLTQTFTFLMEK